MQVNLTKEISYFNAGEPGHEVSFSLVTTHQHVAIIRCRWVADCLLGDYYIHVSIVATLFLIGFAFPALPGLLALGLNGSTFVWAVFTIYSMTFSASLGGTVIPLGTVPFSGLGEVSVLWPLEHPRGLLRVLILLLLRIFIPSTLVDPLLSFLEMLQFLLHVG